MKITCLRWFWFVIFGLKVIMVSGQVEMGIYSGPTRLKLTGDKPKFSKYRSGPGYIAGAIMNIPVAKDVKLSLEPAYIVETANIQTADTIFAFRKKKLEYRDSIQLSFHAFTLPILVKVLSDNQRFQFTSGFEFLYMYSILADNGVEKTIISKDHRKFNIAAQFGVGYIIPVKRSNLSINLHYSHTLNNWSENDPETSYIPRIKISGMRASLAWTIPVSQRKDHPDE